MPEETIQTLNPVDDWSDVDPDYEPILPEDDEQDDIVEDPSELDEDLTEEEIEAPDDLAELLPFWVSYELHGRNLDAETSWALLATEDVDGDLEVEVDGLTAGARWEFRVRLIDRDGRHSRFSEPLVIDLPTDFTPPPAPTEPIVRNVRGYTAVGWDGLLQGPIPGDMSHVQLYVQQQHPDGDPDGEPGDPRRITTMSTAGEHPLLQFLANVLHKAWFTAVDTTGNESPWSPQVEFTPEPPVNEDAIREELDEARQERQQYVEDFDQRTEAYDTAIGELDTRVGPALESSISEAVTQAQANLQGLDQRQEAAEQGISEATDRLGTAEALLAGRERVRSGEGEPDETTAARGFTYEWTGTPHASESVKRVDGVEVARNHVRNPSFETSTSGWSHAAGITIIGRTTFGPAIYAGATAASVATENATASNAHFFVSAPMSISPGQYPAASVALRRSSGATHARLWFEYRSGSAWHSNGGASPVFELSTEDNADSPRHVASGNQAPDGADGIRVWLRLYGGPSISDAPADGITHADAFMAAIEDSSDKALSQVEAYFDGDTEDVLDAPATEGTIYYQTDGDEIIAIWRRSAGEWRRLPLRDEVLASVSVGKLVADGASITDAVVEQLLANKASIIAGEMQKLTVTERADFVSAWADELYADEFTARSSTVVNQTVTGQLIIDGLLQALEGEIRRLFTDETISRIVWAEIVRAGLLEADEGLIGGVLLKEGAVTLDKLHAIEEIAAAMVRTVELEAGTFKTNDMTAMRILSSIIESTIYLIHNADGDVSVRLDGMDNYLAGRLHAGMDEDRGISLDYSLTEVDDDTDEGDEQEDDDDEQTHQIVTPFLRFLTDHNHRQVPRMWIGTDGNLNINPGKVGTEPSSATPLRVWGEIRSNTMRAGTITAISHVVPTTSSNQTGGMARDGDRTRLFGRTPDWSHSRGTFNVGRLGPYRPSSGNYRGSMTFSSPTASGTRAPHLTGFMSNESIDAWRYAIATAGDLSSAGFRFTLNASSENRQMWLLYNGIWD